MEEQQLLSLWQSDSVRDLLYEIRVPEESGAQISGVE